MNAFDAGDIFATTQGERVIFSLSELLVSRVVTFLVVSLLQVFCIFLFLCAASLFGTIIAQVNEIVASVTTKKKVLDGILETYLAMHPA